MLPFYAQSRKLIPHDHTRGEGLVKEWMPPFLQTQPFSLSFHCYEINYKTYLLPVAVHFNCSVSPPFKTGNFFLSRCLVFLKDSGVLLRSESAKPLYILIILTYTTVMNSLTNYLSPSVLQILSKCHVHQVLLSQFCA